MEAINLKDKFRAEIRKKLERIELIHRSMPSLLRSLGIPIEGGVLPSSQEVLLYLIYRFSLSRQMSKMTIYSSNSFSFNALK